ncbi:RecB family exonuclease [Hydrogenophaga sp. XSHU_21]
MQVRAMPLSWTRAWSAPLQAVESAMQDRSVAPSRTVVLLPYTALVPEARRAWMERHPTGLAPRFATPRQWAEALQPWRSGPDDLTQDPARDALVASGWLDRVLRERIDPGLRRELVARLVDAARSLAPLAAATPPAERMGWAEGLRAGLQTVAVARWEGLVAQLALTWAGASSYATDALWTPQARADADLLLAVAGHDAQPLVAALLSARGDGTAWLPAPVVGEVGGAASGAAASSWRAIACTDFEAEASAAAACVIEHLNAGRSPVGLVANDRLLTRRVSALLQGAGVRLRDESGWKLSTTNAAASLMALLRAADARASADDVLDWLKQAPSFDAPAVLSLEKSLRRHGVSRWAAVPEPLRPEGVDGVMAALRAPRPLVHWLRDVATALERSGQWAVLAADAAGIQTLSLLRLGEAAHEFDGLGDSADPAEAGEPAAGADAREATGRRRWTLARFAAWVREALEGAAFQPEAAGVPQVVVVPLPQRLGRALGAVVVPGCDERSAPVGPEPAGDWTPDQRKVLGLPDRDALRASADSAWQTLLDGTPLDLLWRTHDAAEPLLPSPRAVALGLPLRAPPLRIDPVPHQPTERPLPSAPGLLPDRLSASAYDDLRTCPYRFFALRQLRLAEADELDTEPDQRDMGIWLHAVLRAFHEARGDQRPGTDADRAALDALAEEVASEIGLGSEQSAGFLPYRAQWPGLRDGYLRWLEGHEATGARFVAAEADRETSVGRWRLHGRLDRIDQRPVDGTSRPLVIDYKTENRSKTEARIKEPFEDTQIAFYAALLGDDEAGAAYLSLTDGRTVPDEATRLMEPDDLPAVRQALMRGIEHDMERLAAGAGLPALGEGRACEHCAARGLCRKDFWA